MLSLKRPEQAELVLFLISQELKSTRFFNALAKAELHDCYYQCHFSEWVLRELGAPEFTDQQLSLYIRIIEKHSSKIRPSRESIARHAVLVLDELTSVRRKVRRSV